MDVNVNYITTAEYRTRAKRPLNSKLSKKRIKENFYELQNWKSSLQTFIKNLSF